MHLRAILKNAYSSSILSIGYDLIIISIPPLCSCVECRGQKPHSTHADTLEQTFSKRLAVESPPFTQTSTLYHVTIAIFENNQYSFLMNY